MSTPNFNEVEWQGERMFMATVLRNNTFPFVSTMHLLDYQQGYGAGYDPSTGQPRGLPYTPTPEEVRRREEETETEKRLWGISEPVKEEVKNKEKDSDKPADSKNETTVVCDSVKVDGEKKEKDSVEQLDSKDETSVIPQAVKEDGKKEEEVSEKPVDEKEWQCVVCLDTVQDVYVHAQCAHRYHPACMYQWMKRTETNLPTCPMCRAVVKKVYNQKKKSLPIPRRYADTFENNLAYLVEPVQDEDGGNAGNRRRAVVTSLERLLYQASARTDRSDPGPSPLRLGPSPLASLRRLSRGEYITDQPGSLPTTQGDPFNFAAINAAHNASLAANNAMDQPGSLPITRGDPFSFAVINAAHNNLPAVNPSVSNERRRRRSSMEDGEETTPKRQRDESISSSDESSGSSGSESGEEEGEEEEEVVGRRYSI